MSDYASPLRKTEPPQLDEDPHFHLAWAMWRFKMWSANFGTYDEIEDAARDGRLCPLLGPGWKCRECQHRAAGERGEG